MYEPPSAFESFWHQNSNHWREMTRPWIIREATHGRLNLRDDRALSRVQLNGWGLFVFLQ